MSDQALNAVLARLTAKRDRIRRAPALPDASLDSLFADYALRHAHATTALEGNTLTLHETQEVLESGTTIPGKSLREHLEVVNAHAAWLWLRQSLNQRTPFTEDTVLEIHRRLMQGILGDEAGFYRRIPVYILGSRHVPPNPVKVPDLMTEWARSYTQGPGDQHPVAFAAHAHIDLAGIHPFQDGNGRTCRLVVNALLMQSGYPPALYSVASRREYMSALEQAQVDHDPLPFIRVTATATEEMLNRWLHLITEQTEATLKLSQNPHAQKTPKPHRGF